MFAEDMLVWSYCAIELLHHHMMVMLFDTLILAVPVPAACLLWACRNVLRLVVMGAPSQESGFVHVALRVMMIITATLEVFAFANCVSVAVVSLTIRCTCCLIRGPAIVQTH